MRWLLVLVLLLGLFLTGGNVILPPKAWAEMSSVSALYRVEVGTAEAVVNGVTYALAAGDDIYVRDTDQVTRRSALARAAGLPRRCRVDAVRRHGRRHRSTRERSAARSQPSANLTLRPGLHDQPDRHDVAGVHRSAT